MFHTILSTQKIFTQLFFTHLFHPKATNLHIFSLLVQYQAVGEARRDTMLPSILVFCLTAMR